MLRVTLRGLWAHSFRLVATALAVVLGVAFMAGTFVLTDTIRTSFDRLFADANAGTDVLVRAKSPFQGGTFGTERPRVPTALVDRVAAVADVAAAAGRVQGYAQIVGRGGTVLGGTRAPTFGYAWIAAPGLNPFRLADGTAPAAADDVVLDRASRAEGRFRIGDRVHILVKDGAEDFRITGFATFGGADRPLGATAALFRPDTAQRLLGEAGQFDAVVAEARAGRTQVALQTQVAATLDDPGLEVLTGAAATAESQGQVAERLKFFTASLLMFAGVALFVGTFIIYNTFTVVVAQRARELALLRAVGAGRAQVLRSVLLEAVIVGVAASVIGVVAGVGVAAGLRSLLGAVGFRLPAEGLVLAGRTIVVALAVGLVVTGGSAFFPARRAAGVAPLAALRAVEVEPPAGGRVRIGAGLGLLGAGAGLILAGSLRGGAGLRYLGFGGGTGFLALIVLGPAVARPICRALGAPVRRWRGVTGNLARENAMRNPRRTSATASALMIGVGLVAFVAVFATSVKAAVAASVDTQLEADFAVTRQGIGGRIPTDVVTKIGALPEVEVATALRVTRVLIEGARDGIVGIDAASFPRLIDIDVLRGRLDDVAGGGIAVGQTWADDHHVDLGATVPITFTNTKVLNLPVVAIYDKTNLVGTHLIDQGLLTANAVDSFDIAVLIKGAGRPATTRFALDAALEDRPGLQVQDRAELIGDRADEVNQLVGLVYALLFLAVVIALIGIVNTLALSVLERTREIGLLRAVGMSRKQVRSAVRWEAILITLLGTVVGVVAGVVLGVVTVHALADQGLDELRVPVPSLVLVTLGGALFGVVGALLPARRAAKLDVLSAIAEE